MEPHKVTTRISPGYLATLPTSQNCGLSNFDGDFKATMNSVRPRKDRRRGSPEIPPHWGNYLALPERNGDSARFIFFMSF